MALPHGIVVVDKPQGITSRDAVDQACKRLRTREIGHCGTLDPLATGVLVLVVGRARRLQELLARSRKVYDARVLLGATSATDDAEGPIVETVPAPAAPDEGAIREAVARFVGEIEQRPPRYSAVKIDGERLYDLARRGEGIDAPPRKVKVHSIEMLKYEWPHVDLRVACAGGTYVRSIARDMGVVLATGGYLAGLVRTESGGFKLSEATKIDDLGAEHVLPLENALRHFPRVDIAASQAARLANGAAVRVELPPLALAVDEVLFGWVNGQAVALLKKEGPQRVRSQRLLVSVEELQRIAEAELAAGDAAAAARAGAGAAGATGAAGAAGAALVQRTSYLDDERR